MKKPAALGALICSVLMAAAAGAAPGPVSIATGETIVLRLGADGTASVQSRAAAPPLSRLEQAALAQMKAVQVPPGAETLPAMPLQSAEGAEPPAIPSGLVRLTFREVPGGSDAMLTIENGYDRAFRYRAVMHHGAKSRATDVCEVPPHKPGFEYWPFRIERLELSATRLERWQDGQGVRCE
ncbi:MAG TPA: hypothetical protein VGW34_05260 [Allosphingosinicella sp.]|nr:hypothetical protein [Allosphingosinicella sp.]